MYQQIAKFLFCLICISTSIPANAKDDAARISVVGKDRPRLVVQKGHGGAVHSVAFSPDGTLMVSGGATTLKLWDVASGRELQTMSGHARIVTSVAFSPDGKTVASGSADSTIKLWDIFSGTELRTMTGHGNVVSSVAFSPDGKTLVSGSYDQTIKLWNLATGQTLCSLLGHQRSVQSVAFSPNGKMIVSGSDDKSVRIWDLINGVEVHRLTGHGEFVKSVAFSPDGTMVASGGLDNTIKLWNVVNGSELRTINEHERSVKAIIFSPDSKTLASVDESNVIKLWSVDSGIKLRTLDGSGDQVNAIAFSPDGKRLVSGNSDGTLSLWNMHDGQLLLNMKGYGTPVNTVDYSPDGKTIVFGSDDNTLKIVDLADGHEPRVLIGHGGKVTTAVFSPDGKMLASGSWDHTVKIWDVVSGRQLRTLTGHSEIVVKVAFSPDGEKLVSGGYDNTLKIWDVSSGRELFSMVGEGTLWQGSVVESVAFSPDGKIVVSGSSGVENNFIKLWDVASGQELLTLSGQGNIARPVIFSPDGKTIAFGSYDHTIKIWDVASGQELRSLAGHLDDVRSLVFSKDGKTIVSGSDDHMVKLWDVAGGREINTLMGHGASVNSVALSPDGNSIASGSDDQTIKIWEISTGRNLATVIVFSDRRWVVTDAAGRFDTADLEDMNHLHWIMPDAPLTPVPLEAFMKEYYEPRLLARILNGETLKPVRNLMTLNRVLPTVSISAVTRENNGNNVSVTMQIAGQKRTIGSKNIQSDVADLKLFRSGQLVGFREGKIELNKDGTQTITFYNIRLPKKGNVKEVEFSAYAFNDDGIKSLTSRTTFAMPADVIPAKGKAYLVNIGVNRYQNAAWNLQYAASDAQKIRQSLEKRIPKVADYSDVIPITLTDENATKENIKAVFDLLSGESVPADLTQRIPNADKLAKATPEDLLIISFSGHGHVDDNGIFYTFSHDTGAAASREVTSELLSHIISSDELSRWLRYVDAGDMAMIVDACHSAATVGDGFKPGPMGSRGLGQLAYDKGMRILAASQADDVALESDKLQQGLLTYSLVHDGLDAFQADFKPADKNITLSELLAYAVYRVPKLYEEVKSDNLSTFGRGEASRATVVRLSDKKTDSLTRKNPYQTPALFDFTRKQKGDVAVAGERAKQ